MSYRNELLRISGEIDSRRLQCLKELKHLPKGELHIEKSRKYTQYRRFYEKNGKAVRVSITKDPEMVRKLKRKAFLEQELRILDQDAVKVSRAANSVQGNDFKTIKGSLRHGLENLDETDFCYQTQDGIFIPRPVRDQNVRIRPLSLCLEGIDPYEWAVTPYRENTAYLENKHHMGVTGLNYRSRAELHIFEHIITKRRQPVHYDEVVEIDGEYFSPDGIAPNLRGEIILIEYAEIDDEDYLRRNAHKLEAYRRKGFVLGRNLVILSCETNDFINTPKIDRILDAFLLN